MAETTAERSEVPTPRRLEEARLEGNVASSTDLTAACILLASMALLYFVGQRLMGAMMRILERGLTADSGSRPTVPDDIGAMFVFSGKVAVAALAPFVLGITAVVLLATVGQVGLLITARPLRPNFGRLSPVRGIKNLIGIRAVVRLLMSLAKLAAILAVAGVAIAGDLPKLVMLAHLEPGPMFAAASGIVFLLGLKLAALLLLLALIDFGFQKSQRMRDLRMTKEEVKEEMKRMEGDPLIRQRRGRVARQLALQRVAHAVPNSDVVVTNPTHYSVALQYDSEKMKAPKVVAKGADFMALRIRQLAIAHGVPIVERKALAQSMYRTVEVGQEVLPQFYNAVAEILAYVYRLSSRRTA